MEIVEGYAYLKEIKGLILEYQQQLGRDLQFQSFEEELYHLEAKYGKGQGRLLACIMDGQVVGCVAYQRLSKERCEMKRLYVQSAYRQHHLGRQLVTSIMALAKADGFQEMVLDTILPLQAAIHLYQSVGFEQTVPYYDNPMEDVIYMKCIL